MMLAIVAGLFVVLVASDVMNVGKRSARRT